MNKTEYHHGNLKEALIEAGIQIIQEEGFQALSLRKAAAMCGVSHAAPKSHFDNKESFEEAIKQYITEDFTRYLEEAVRGKESEDTVVRDLGRAYVQFFHLHPERFSLITNQNDIHILMSKETVQDSDYPPFALFQKIAADWLIKRGVNQNDLSKEILFLWAQVNGLAGISVMKGFHFEGDWMEMVNRIINFEGR